MVKRNQAAYGVRVKLNDNFKVNSLTDKYLKEMETVLFIDYQGVMNDSTGDYVYVKGGSLINSGMVYLTEIDLEFPIPEKPLY